MAQRRTSVSNLSPAFGLVKRCAGTNGPRADRKPLAVCRLPHFHVLFPADPHHAGGCSCLWPGERDVKFLALYFLLRQVRPVELEELGEVLCEVDVVEEQIRVAILGDPGIGEIMTPEEHPLAIDDDPLVWQFF